MTTLYLDFTKEDLQYAGSLIQKGKLVAFPTETVYGLGSNALDEDAVKSTYLAKGRPSDNPLIVHVYDKQQIYQIASEVSDDAKKIIDSLMPGSITVVLPKKSIIPNCVTAGLSTVAIRMPQSVQARQFLSYCKVPVAAPSANTSSRPSPTTWQTVKEDMDGKIAAVLKGEPCLVGIESTVLDLSQGQPTVLRPGIITPQQICEVLGKPVRLVTDPKEKVNSPGVRYKHYAPKVPMVLELNGDIAKLKAYYLQCVNNGYNPVLLVQHPEEFIGYNVCSIGDDDRQTARTLFENLRILEKKYSYIIASYSSHTDLAVSVLNRLTRSAGQNII